MCVENKIVIIVNHKNMNVLFLFGLCAYICTSYSVLNGDDVPYDEVFVLEHESRVRRQAGEPKSSTTPNTVTPSGNSDDLRVYHDNHGYYTTQYYQSPDINNALWVSLDESYRDTKLTVYQSSKSVNLPFFNFTFYGHTVEKVSIGSGGFLYTSEFLHQWLTATNYIAPLMANFDLSMGDNSMILHRLFGSMFVVEWRDVFLQEQNETTDKPFQFQCIIYQNGTIAFLYRKVPISPVNINTAKHPRKIGVSDAFYIDTVENGITRRTIYEYHHISINQSLIQEHTTVILSPLTTCNLAKDCETCVSQNTTFICSWCPAVERCSDGVDRFRGDWLDKGCLKSAVSESCPHSTESSYNGTTESVYKGTTESSYNGTTESSYNGTTGSSYNGTTESSYNVTTESSYNGTTESSYNGTTESFYNDTTESSFNDTTESYNGTTESSYNGTTKSSYNGTTESSYNGTTESSYNGTTESSYNSTTDGVTEPKTSPGSTPKSETTETVADAPKSESQTHISTVIIVVVIVVLVLAVLGAVGGLLCYARSHPTSSSGIWLVEHGFSRMKERPPSVNFTNNTYGEMGVEY